MESPALLCLGGKFGDLAEVVAAVWFWNKLRLQGGSRSKGGAERLAYYRGGFAALAEAIRAQGGEIRIGVPADGLRVDAKRVTGLVTPGGYSPSTPWSRHPRCRVVTDLVEPHVPDEYTRHLRHIRYLANVSVVLQLDRSLSEMYWWLNVNDPGFPFVGGS